MGVWTSKLVHHVAFERSFALQSGMLPNAGRNRFAMALQHLQCPAAPSLRPCMHARPFGGKQRQRACAQPAVCSALHDQQPHGQPSLERRQFLAAAAAVLSARSFPAAAYTPPPPGQLVCQWRTRHCAHWCPSHKISASGLAQSHRCWNTQAKGGMTTCWTATCSFTQRTGPT